MVLWPKTASEAISECIISKPSHGRSVPQLPQWMCVTCSYACTALMCPRNLLILTTPNYLHSFKLFQLGRQIINNQCWLKLSRHVRFYGIKYRPQCHQEDCNGHKDEGEQEHSCIGPQFFSRLLEYEEEQSVDSQQSHEKGGVNCLHSYGTKPQLCQTQRTEPLKARKFS